ncbi:MAG: class I SAM-dependent methyltransferase [Chitinophagaceae bacterium]|nr:class I SAM-dependent methyltransferase [Chitinophagaceae bacterium]
MYSHFKMALKYCHYWLTASNRKGHGMHSPYVFNLIQDVLLDERKFYQFESIEQLRKLLLKNETEIEVVDFGAGSKNLSNKKRKISAIAKSSLKPKKYSQLLFRFVDYYQPQTIIELGTSLGITTSYLASSNVYSVVYTFEGAPSIANIAEQNFESLQLKNINLNVGNFDNTLEKVLSTINKVDFAFIDGNHRYEPTINYFNQLLSKSNEQSIFILDDIHWSEEMETAWKYVQLHEKVTATIDLFFIGIVIFNKDFRIKQHFTVKY